MEIAQEDKKQQNQDINIRLIKNQLLNTYQLNTLVKESRLQTKQMRITSGSSSKYSISQQTRGPIENGTTKIKVQAQYMIKNNSAQSSISRHTGQIGGQKKSIIPLRNEGNSIKQKLQIKNNSRNLTQPKNVNKLESKNDPSIQWSQFAISPQNKPQTSNTIFSDITQNQFDNKNQNSSLKFESMQNTIFSQGKIIVQSSTINQTGENRFAHEKNKTSVTYHQAQMSMQVHKDQYNDSGVAIPILQDKLELISQMQLKIAESILTNSQLKEPFSSQFLQQLSSFFDSEYPSSSIKNSQLLKQDRNKLKAQPCKYCPKQEFNLSLKTMCQQCFTKFLLGYQLQEINTKKVETNQRENLNYSKIK